MHSFRNVSLPALKHLPSYTKTSKIFYNYSDTNGFGILLVVVRIRLATSLIDKYKFIHG